MSRAAAAVPGPPAPATTRAGARRDATARASRIAAPCTVMMPAWAGPARRPGRGRPPAAPARPVDIVKPSPVSVAAIDTDPDQAAAFHAVRYLVDSARRRLMAKDVETADQVASAPSLGCAAGQGYQCSLAVPARDMTDLLRCGVIPTARRVPVTPGDHGVAVAR